MYSTIFPIKAAFLVLLVLSIVGNSAGAAFCPLFGPEYPASQNLLSNKALTAASQSMKQALAKAIKTETVFGRLDFANTAFSVDLYSVRDQQSLFTYHYTPPILRQATTGVKSVDSNTIYRVGSISKLWTVYIYLIAAGDTSWNDAITNYVPELAALNHGELGVAVVDWSSVTVGSLASQMAGIARDAAYSPPFEAELISLGFTPPSRNRSMFCGVPSVDELPCTRSDFFSNLYTLPPVALSFRTPIYSNIAFQILAYALENITSTSFKDLFTDRFVTPLGLTATSYSMPSSNTNSIIPINATISLYDADLLDEAPAGGYYSSINDMKQVGKAILNSTLFSPAQTRRWMKPHTFTSRTNSAVGAPWEILLAPGNRTSWIYTKEGDLGLYSGQTALLPDYNVGFSVLAAGEHAVANVKILSDMMASEFVPTLENAARSEAEIIFAGTYVDEGTNSTLTLTTNYGPGLAVTQWTLGGNNVILLLGQLQNKPAPPTVRVHLYPTGLQNENGTTVGWRAVFEDVGTPTDLGTFSTNCDTWESVDLYTYGGIGLDEFVFILNSGSGTSIGVQLPALGLELERKTRSE